MNQKTAENRPLTQEEIETSLERLASDINGLYPTKIVALGKTAAKALTLLGVAFYEMPHPSGRNRKLNDKEFVSQKIKELTEFCNKVSSDINSN
jgi:uracil-DNA glycosylase